MTLLKDLIGIPEHLGKGDFVFTLENAVDSPDQVLKDYVVTRQLQESFDEALSQIQNAVASGESQANYLHGSFGSGKSHFMAVLYLLLSHVPEARAIPELHGSLRKHDVWLEGKKFLLVPVHMINANVNHIEEGVIAAYVRRIQHLHPEAELPPVYRSGALLKNAEELRASLGDDAFFGSLNYGSSGDEGLGQLAGPRWDAETFAAARVGAPGDAQHDALVSALISTLFSSFDDVARGDQFVSLEQGLSAMSRHSESLGYDGLILFLDELILWLATRMADLDWVRQEAQKMATLKEAPLSERPVPVISFIARQRNLRDLVGEHNAGADQASVHDSLSYSEGRFHTITLEDRNLRAIAERRVLRPKNDDAKAEIDAAFETTVRAGGNVLDVLLGESASQEDFRAVYPFSPAFVDTLVAASSALQRERTAIRVMVQLLSEHRNEIELGDVIAVGELFGVLSGADEPFSPELKRQFKEAQSLYESFLRPLILDYHKVPEGQTLSGAAHAEDLLVKTLLLAALIPDAKPLRGLTASRLVALNHGTIATPIPGEEENTALTALKRLRGNVGQLKIQDGTSDPTVQIELAGIDTDSIIRSAAPDHDNAGRRKRYVRDFIYEQLDVSGRDALFSRFGMTWQGIDREAEVAVENVRELSAENANAFGTNWKLIIDFPFDAEDSGRADDFARIEQLQEGIESSRTVFWLPAFVTRAVERDLGKLVTIDALLSGDRLVSHTPNLSDTERVKARSILESQLSQLRASVREAFEQAYGIANPKPDMVEAQDVEFHSLDPGLDVRVPVGRNLREASEALLAQLLRHQFPAAPELLDRVTPGKINKTWGLVRRAIDEPNGRLEGIEQADRKLLKDIATPLELGIMHEGPFVLGQEWRERFVRAMSQEGLETPTVVDLRRWINEPDPRGLTSDLERLVVLTFAAQNNRGFELHGGPATPTLPSEVDDALRLVEVPLPSEEDWQRAKDRAAGIFGIVMSPLRSAQNLGQAGADITSKAIAFRDPVRDLKAGIEGNLLPVVGVGTDTERVRETREAELLLDELAGATPAEAVAALAAFELSTTPESLGSAIGKARATSEALGQANWQLLGAVTALAERDPAAKAALEPLAKAASEPEIATPLAAALSAATNAATGVLAARDPEPKPAAGATVHRGLSVGEAQAVLNGLIDAADKTIDLTISDKSAAQGDG